VLTGTFALWIEVLRGLVTTGVDGTDGIAVRTERTAAMLVPLSRMDDREALGSELKDDSCDMDVPLAGRIEDQLGLPKTPWMDWMRCAGMVRAMILVTENVSVK